MKRFNFTEQMSRKYEVSERLQTMCTGTKFYVFGNISTGITSSTFESLTYNPYLQSLLVNLDNL